MCVCKAKFSNWSKFKSEAISAIMDSVTNIFRSDYSKSLKKLYSTDQIVTYQNYVNDFSERDENSVLKFNECVCVCVCVSTMLAAAVRALCSAESQTQVERQLLDHSDGRDDRLIPSPPCDFCHDML